MWPRQLTHFVNLFVTCGLKKRQQTSTELSGASWPWAEHSVEFGLTIFSTCSRGDTGDQSMKSSEH